MHAQTQIRDPLALPQRPSRGRLSAAQQRDYDADLDRWAKALLELQSTFGQNRYSSRGWCYLLEEHGLTKGEFSKAQDLINACRKNGRLPIHFTREDSAREPDGLTFATFGDADRYAAVLVDSVRDLPLSYRPYTFADFTGVYVEMLVEKIDLRTLFSKTCRTYYVPISNGRGWSDINSRAALMQRFKSHEKQGHRCVLLYCGDFDPAGLLISDALRANFEEIAGAVGWNPDRLVIDRFGLNFDFIEAHGLSWIEGLETGSGARLDDPQHRDHQRDYVQNYLRQYGARKVEANVLVTRPDAARALCRDAIQRYLSGDALASYLRAMVDERKAFEQVFLHALADEFGGSTS